MKKKSKIKGQEFEELVKNTINSGALSFDKGDLKTKDYVIECKFTDKKGYRITQKLLEKIWNDALDAHKLPRLVIGFPRNETELFMIACNIEIKRKPI